MTSGFTADSNSWDYSVANALVQFLAENETITFSFTVTVTDDSGASNNSDFDVVTIVLTGTNDGPQTTLDFVPTNEDTALVSGNVLTNDSDPDANGSLEVISVRLHPSAGTASAAAGDPLSNPAFPVGVLVVNADGTFDYQLDTENPFIQGLQAGSSTAEVFFYTVRNSFGVETEEQLTISIAGANDAPVGLGRRALGFDRNGTAQVIDAAIELSDVDNATLQGATVSITQNFATGEDALGFTDQNGITGL